MAEEDLGEATIVYETPEDGTVERTVQNEHLAYFQDHWIVKMGDDEDGDWDIVRRIPTRHVHYVEREVDEFEEEVKTLRNQVQSFADDVRSKFLGESEDDDQGPLRIDVESDDDSDK
ncbi:hypothetical protein [Haloarcula nitratireducens]|mgnify:CR=1 FL=1|uniref:Uncharacterized protein n=1 Tax=Haloarcula nitratireducens TaxID=2487749 RepID=A0AAW4PBV4_9EURY|nr:hypothetical protein [Halomicroarcula nitratireducens]MBX0295339.1 hypothetical protein [Halomicroarcula nitratireducens]